MLSVYLGPRVKQKVAKIKALMFFSVHANKLGFILIENPRVGVEGDRSDFAFEHHPFFVRVSDARPSFDHIVSRIAINSS